MMIIGYSRSIDFSYILNYQVHHPDYLNRRSKDQQGQGMVLTHTRLPVALTQELVLNLIRYLHLSLFFLMRCLSLVGSKPPFQSFPCLHRNKVQPL